MTSETMKCYDCQVEVEPQSYPEGKCPDCGLTYTLRDSAWDWYTCPDCGNEDTSQFCTNCNNWYGEEY